MSLRNNWYIAAESKELGGKPLPVTIHGEPLVLFRDSTGKACCILDRCAHRNMPLSLGRVKEGCIECPYHGWRFDGNGRCTTIPALGAGADIPSSVEIRHRAVIEREGFVWVYTGAALPAGQPFCFPHIGETGWTTFTMKTRFDGGVEACLENFLDCPHTVFVHRGWFRNPDSRPIRARVRRHATGVDVEFQDEIISGSVASALFFTRGSVVKHTDRFIMPNISRVDYDFGPNRTYVITSQCTPIDDNTTEVYTAITYKFGMLNPWVKLFFKPLCRKIIRQDVDILRDHTRHLKRFEREEFNHVATDLLGLHIHSLRLRHDRGDSPLPDSEKEITIRF